MQVLYDLYEPRHMSGWLLAMQTTWNASGNANQRIPTMNKFTKAAADVNLRQVVRPERLWETRGSRLPLRSVFRLWIGIGTLWNLDRPLAAQSTSGALIGGVNIPKQAFGNLCVMRSNLYCPSSTASKRTGSVLDCSEHREYSERNWRRKRSVSLKSLKSETSSLLNPGPATCVGSPPKASKPVSGTDPNG